MCIICNQTPCHPRCPNAPETVIDGCTMCYDEIKEGYSHYEDDNGNLFCSMDCALDYYGIKEQRQ